MNQTSRIESYSVGGEILVSESVYKTAGEILRINSQRDVSFKGSEFSVRTYNVDGIAGTWHLALDHEVSDKIVLKNKIPVSIKIVDKKDVQSKETKGSISMLSKSAANIILSDPVPVLTNLKMNLSQVDDRLASAYFYCKVMGLSDKRKNEYTIMFTAVPVEIEAFFQGIHFNTTKKNKL